MPTEIQPRLLLDELVYGKLPPYWDDKPVVQGLVKAEDTILQAAVDLCWQWINGTTISTAVGKNLDDIGYLWNIDRQRRDDDTYRQAILGTMLGSYDSGTIPDVKRLIKNLTSPTRIRTTLYPNTRYLSVHIEGASADKSTQDVVNKAVSSGARSQLHWEPSNVCLMPAIRLSVSSTDELLGELDTGTTSLVVELGGGATDTLGIRGSSETYGYFAAPERSLLPFTLESASAGVTLDFINDSGDALPFDAVLPGGLTDSIEISGGATSAVISSGRTLALMPRLL